MTMFEIRKEENKTYRFELKSVDGQNLLDSVSFKSKHQIKKTINELGPTTLNELLFERKTDYNGKFLFNLKSPSGQLIGNSGLFESEAGMENGIKHIKKRIADLSPDFIDL